MTPLVQIICGSHWGSSLYFFMVVIPAGIFS
jgi:hypothetical protein